MDFPILSVLALIPVVGAVSLIFLRGALAKQVALAAALGVLVLAVVLAAQFEPGAGMQFTELASWRDFDDPGQTSGALAPRYGLHVFFALVLAVEACALYLFLATDVFLFYVFFEVILVPMYFLIGGFGPGPRRTYAAAKFLIFGLLGGFVMLASVIGLYVQSSRAGQPSYLLSTLSELDIATGTGRWLFVGFMFAFAIKAPLVPLHTWLPDAAEESTAGGATMMVG